MHITRWMASLLAGILALAAMAVSAAQPATGWTESVNGDLSNNGLAPTPVTFLVGGTNEIIGITGNPGSGVDRDYFTFTVPQGYVLNTITVLPNTYVSGSVSFFAIQRGPQVTSTNGAGLLGFGHYGADLIGQNILTQIGPSQLPAGTYSVWVQETGGMVEYGLAFGFVAAPDAGDAPTLPQWGTIFLGVLLVFAMYRRRLVPVG